MVGTEKTLRSKTSHGPTGRLRTEDTGENGRDLSVKHFPEPVPATKWMGIRTPARNEGRIDGDLSVKYLARSHREAWHQGHWWELRRPIGQVPRTVGTPARTEVKHLARSHREASQKGRKQSH